MLRNAQTTASLSHEHKKLEAAPPYFTSSSHLSGGHVLHCTGAIPNEVYRTPSGRACVRGVLLREILVRMPKREGVRVVLLRYHNLRDMYTEITVTLGKITRCSVCAFICVCVFVCECVPREELVVCKRRLVVYVCARGLKLERVRVAIFCCHIHAFINY